VTIARQEQVVRFDVSMDRPMIVRALQSVSYLAGNADGLVHWELLVALQARPE
jgi:hypothetical protein